MYRKQKKQLKSFLNSNVYNDELFSRNSMTAIIRALLEPVANQNANSLIFTRIKNKEGLDGLIKRLEYCTNVEMIDVTNREILIKDDYIELEFVIFTSARYNFALLFDYSEDVEKNHTKAFFLANSRNVNDVFEVLQSNLNVNYREKFYLHKPERRENELLNEVIFNVFKKLNNSIEENSYKTSDNLIIDLSDEDNMDEKIKEVSHEIKNQLSILDIYTKILEKENGKNKNIEVIKKAASIIALQLKELKNYESAQIKEIVVQDVIEESINMFGAILAQNNNKIEFKNSYNFDLRVFADENKLLSVFNNIVKNANESSKDDTITFSINVENHQVNVDIENHGEEIDSKNCKHIFDKGFSTKTKGSGIGLYACRNYIESFNGTLTLLTSKQEHTIFRITLPLS